MKFIALALVAFFISFYSASADKKPMRNKIIDKIEDNTDLSSKQEKKLDKAKK